MDLSGNLRSIIAQRLVPTSDGKGRKPAIEILINTPTIAERILNGEFHELKAIMEKSRELGMRTFDWSLFGLYNDGHIGYEDALRNADSANELRLNIKLRSARGEPAQAAGLALTIDEMDEAIPEKDLAEAREREMRRQRERVQQRVEDVRAEQKRQYDLRHRQEDAQLETLRKAKLSSLPVS
jgi:twitching motility protein PilU